MKCHNDSNWMPYHVCLFFILAPIHEVKGEAKSFVGLEMLLSVSKLVQKYSVLVNYCNVNIYSV